MFQQEFDFKTKYNLDLSDDQVMQLKKIFAIANLDHSGIIGRRQVGVVFVALCLAHMRELTWPRWSLRSSPTS